MRRPVFLAAAFLVCLFYSERAEEAEEELFFPDVEVPDKHGINVTEPKKLQAAGICTMRGLLMTTKKRLGNIKGFSEAKVDKLKEVALRLSNPGFVTALEVASKRRLVFKISTGSGDLDGDLLSGGIQSQAITEIFGEFRTGKTQIAHTLCVTTQLPRGNYRGGKVMYLDTEQHTFRPDRLRGIAQRFGVDEKVMLNNVLYACAFTPEHQVEILDYVAAKFHEEGGVFKLLIVDSVMALFRVDYTGRGKLAERQQKLAQLLSRLQKLAEEYNVAVLLTNQMTADPGAGLTFQVDPKKPIGGHILAHASTTRVMLRKGRAETRIAEVYDSSDLHEFRTGKTQIALCVTQLPRGNYRGGKVMYLDTEQHTFRPDRLRGIAQRFGVDEEAMLDNVLYARAFTPEHQAEILDNVAAKFHREGQLPRVLVVPVARPHRILPGRPPAPPQPHRPRRQVHPEGREEPGSAATLGG